MPVFEPFSSEPIIPPTRDTNENIWICNFPPHYCPTCGDDITFYRRPFNTGKSFFCGNCNTHFQRATNTAILNAADESNGDLAQYTELI